MEKKILIVILCLIIMGCRTGINPAADAKELAPQPRIDSVSDPQALNTTQESEESAESEEEKPEENMEKSEEPSAKPEENAERPDEAAVTFIEEDSPSETTDQEEKEMPNPIVLMKTTEGDIKIELFMDTMPLTAGNFKKLVEEEFYNNVIFHRVIPDFMIQGGDPTGTGAGGPGYNIKDEFTDNNRNKRATLSMANAGPNTGGSQFFINIKDNAFLDTKHPVFGKVLEGMDVVDKISKVNRNQRDKPVKDVVMLEVKIVEG